MVHSSKKLPCGHIFHTACLRSWFQRQQTCPTCRLNILRTTSRPAAANNQNDPNANPPNPVLPDANPANAAQGIQNNMPPGNSKENKKKMLHEHLLREEDEKFDEILNDRKRERRDLLIVRVLFKL